MQERRLLDYIGEIDAKGWTLVFINALFVLASLLVQAPVLFAASLFILLLGIEFCLKDPVDRGAMLLFLLASFLFLYGRDFTIYYLGQPKDRNFVSSTNEHAWLCLILSTVSLIAGFLYARFWEKLRPEPDRPDPERRGFLSKRKSVARRYAAAGMLITVIPYYAEALVSGLYVQKNGYLSFYTTYRSPLPNLFVQLGELFAFFFFLHLASFPERKKCTLPILLYLGHGALMLMSGRRLFFGTSIFLIMTYVIARHLLNKEEGWLTPRRIAALCIAAPVLMVFLYAFRYIRYDTEITSTTGNMIVDFLSQQGGSINIIKYQKEMGGKELGPCSLYYTLKFLRTGKLTGWLSNFPRSYYANRDAHMAFDVNNLGAYISYLVIQRFFEHGGGYGTCYIAELYHDGGYLLVILGNFLYGLIFRRLLKFSGKNLWKLTIGLLMFEKFIVMPRYGADFFLSPFYNVNILVPLILCVIHINALIDFRMRDEEEPCDEDCTDHISQHIELWGDAPVCGAVPVSGDAGV